LDEAPSNQRTLLRTEGSATFFREDNLTNGVWVEVPRIGEPGTVGGYLLDNPQHRGALIVVLPGASTFAEDGMVGRALRHHREWLRPYQQAGYLTWVLVLRECGTPYGRDDLADARAALRWLLEGGQEALGVSRIYLLGYSSGAIVALLANLEFDLAGVVAIDALTQPDQLERLWYLYDMITRFYPRNGGMCQLRSTLYEYGVPGDPAWDAIDLVSRAHLIRNPTLLIHGERDPVFFSQNSIALHDAYVTVQSTHPHLPPLELALIRNAGHYGMIDNPVTAEKVLDFLERMETTAEQKPKQPLHSSVRARLSAVAVVAIHASLQLAGSSARKLPAADRI